MPIKIEDLTPEGLKANSHFGDTEMIYAGHTTASGGLNVLISAVFNPFGVEKHQLFGFPDRIQGYVFEALQASVFRISNP